MAEAQQPRTDFSAWFAAHPRISIDRVHPKQLEVFMHKFALVLASVTMIGFVSAPAALAAATCAEELTKVQGKIDATTDAKKKDAATAQITTAKDAQAKNDEAGCLKAVERADDALD
jgi:type IV secretory pathway VirB6-like protein